MYNVVCLKYGTKYNSDYVNKLFSGVKRNTTLEFKFHCFTEDSDGVNKDIIIHPLICNNIDGWWNKLYLFSNKVNIDGRVLFIDLDTLITGNIDDLLKVTEGFVMIKDFFYPLQNYDGSGLMSFETKQHPEIWDKFIANPSAAIKELHPHGDQRWIVKFVDDITHWQDILPEQIMSFKLQCANSLPDNARVVCYHGKPSIPESINTTTRTQGVTLAPAKWVKEYWRV